MNIRDLQKNWDEFGKTDPLWSILVTSDRKKNNWQIDEFFKTGAREIDAVIKYIESLGIDIQRRKALDFGCGVGRLTQALASYFDEVSGIDIAPSMIELAKKYNRYGDKCKYYLNCTTDLKLFSDDSFDFIYTNITLQHIKPKYSKKYIKEFLRIIVPGGLIIFQLPSKRSKVWKRLVVPIVPSVLLKVYRKVKYGDQPIMEMYGIKREDVIGFLEENGARIVDVKEDHSTDEEWLGFRYYVIKK